MNGEFSCNVKSVVMKPVDLVSLRYDLRRHSRVTRALSFAPTVSLNVSSKEGMTHHVSSAESRSAPEVSFLSSVMQEIECASKTYTLTLPSPQRIKFLVPRRRTDTLAKIVYDTRLSTSLLQASIFQYIRRKARYPPVFTGAGPPHSREHGPC